MKDPVSTDLGDNLQPLPMVPLRDVVVFPYTMIPFVVGRRSSLSAVEKALVVGTSNKTEILLGYSTLWGDMAAAIQPLGDLYKCEVRALARVHAALVLGVHE